MMRKKLLAAIWTVLLCLSAASAETVILPSGTTEVEEEAFSGCTSVTCVELPEGVTFIGPSAFSGCSSLGEVFIPPSVTRIGEKAFENCMPALWLHCSPGSEALDYAKANRIDYDAETIYRALIVAENYSGTAKVLYGPSNDARSMYFCLSEMNAAPWTVRQKTNLTAEGILNAIDDFFAGTTENDVSLLYYSGHGEADGSLIGADLAELSPALLRSRLDRIPGRKIVIVDACCSGMLIDTEEQGQKSPVGLLREDTTAEQDVSTAFQNHFMSVFCRLLRGALNADSYYVITAATQREITEEGLVTSGSSSKMMGFFTYALCEGLGWNGVTSRAGELLADQNGDRTVTIVEAARYACARARQFNPSQTAAFWPLDSDWFSPFRP